MTSATASDRPDYAPDGEVVELCSDLIRFDTTNYGNGKSNGERDAAEYVAAKLDEVGIESTIYESEPGRATLVAHWEGRMPRPIRCWCTGTWTSYRLIRRTGRSTRSRGRSSTGACGGAARST